jgi:hypothetical protein
MCSITRIRRRLRHLRQVRRLLSNSGGLFHRRRSSLAEGEHTITFVSSIPFRFAIQSTVSLSFPSNPLCLPSLSVPLEPASMAEPPPPADSRLLRHPPPLVSPPLQSPRPSHSFSCLSRALSHWSPDDKDGQELLHAPVRRPFLPGGWRDKAICFAIRSLEKKEIPTYDMCLVLFVENPLQESLLSHIKPT